MGFMEGRRNYSKARDIGVLVVRLTNGGLLAGHGAQKLFGWFNGPGFEGASGWMESMGFKPGEQWATAAGASEFGGGVLTALGLFHPIGPISTIGAMAVAARKAHAGKPIWVTEGGAELPVTNIAIAFALSMVGPGRYSLDHMLGIKVPKELAIATAIGVGLGIVSAEAVEPPAQDENAADESAAA